MVVCTGVSGSGKSSLAFGVVYAEAQRRIFLTLPQRQRGGMPSRPAFAGLTGLPPAIGLSQRGSEGLGPRCTVGTVAEVLEDLRSEWVRHGTLHCPGCGKALEVMGTDAIVRRLAAGPEGEKLVLLAPIVRQQKTGMKALLSEMERAGFLRIRLDGEVLAVDEVGVLDSRIPHDLDVVVDRFKRSADRLDRLQESVETGLKLGKGRLFVEEGGRLSRFSNRYQCPDCERTLAVPSSRGLNWNSPAGWCIECRGLGCENCGGTRLNEAARSLKVGEHSLPEVCTWSLRRLWEWIEEKRGFEDAKIRIRFLLRVGLGYLSLDRPADSLSTGELQRLRLSACAASPLEGVLYVLDEPTAGLHPGETGELLGLLREMVEEGASLLVVEHDPQVVAAADWVVDLGPGAGAEGGHILFEGRPEQLLETDTPTGRWLSGREQIPLRTKRRETGKIRVTGARGRGTSRGDWELPLGGILGVTGPSGAGKRSLILETVGRALSARLGMKGPEPLPFERLEGTVERVVWADVGEMGRSPRAMVATLTGVWGGIRALLAHTPEARQRGFGPERFGFHAGGGRCEACLGTGVRRHGVPCEVCEGRRFDASTLSVRWKGHSADDLLRLSIREARRLFTHHRRLARVLERLESLGLGYLPLGQRGDQISGGERQRLRLGRELERSQLLPGTLYLLQEPSVGLHPADVERLVACLRGMVDGGASVWLIDQDPALLSACDWVLEMSGSSS